MQTLQVIYRQSFRQLAKLETPLHTKITIRQFIEAALQDALICQIIERIKFTIGLRLQAHQKTRA